MLINYFDEVLGIVVNSGEVIGFGLVSVINKFVYCVEKGVVVNQVLQGMYDLGVFVVNIQCWVDIVFVNLFYFYEFVRYDGVGINEFFMLIVQVSYVGNII